MVKPKLLKWNSKNIMQDRPNKNYIQREKYIPPLPRSNLIMDPYFKAKSPKFHNVNILTTLFLKF